MSRTILATLAVVSIVLVTPGALRSQSITGGALAGAVHDSVGRPLTGARVTASRDGGASQSVFTDREGRFEFAALAAGEYTVFAEHLGYRPVRVLAVPVRPMRTVEVAVVLAPAAPPVDRVEVVRFRSGGVASEAGSFPLGIDRLPAERRELSVLARLVTRSSADLEVEGLPAALSGLVIDGVPYVAARHPALAVDPLRAAAFPLSAIDHAELVTNGVDVEWSNFAGGVLSAQTRPGSGTLGVRGFGTWSGDALASSGLFDPGAVPHTAWQGGIAAGGPLIEDTAYFSVGIEAQRIERAFPQAWPSDSIAAAVRAVAQDTFGIGLDGYAQPRLFSADVVSGFARVDWQVARGHTLSVRANVATLSPGDLEPGALPFPSDGATAEGRDISAAATLTSALGDRFSQEIRVGFTRSRREYDAAADAPPGTVFGEGGLAFGVDPALPGRFQRSAFRASQALYLRTGAHRLKSGIAATLVWHDDLYAHGRGGRFAFSDANGFATREGAFTRTTGPAPVARYMTPQIGVFFQDTWTAVPGLDITAGVRFEFEGLPVDEVQPNAEWLRLAGLDNADVPDQLRKVSPRLGFSWDVREDHQWLLHGGAGIYYDRVAPEVLGEWLTHDGRLVTHRAFGSLGSWPTIAAPLPVADSGAALTLLGPDFMPPRTARASFGITRRLGENAALHLSAALRRTDFLPRRHDLNLAQAPAATDQYGRPVYGTLVKQGALLAPEPGSNRRFPGFDLVSALDADGHSDYWGLTVAFERRAAGPLDLFASYTYSRTRDDWLGATAAPEDGLHPFPDPTASEDWAEGTSDFDVPHRFALGAEMRFPVLNGLRIAGLYRYRSGTPFTPGFRDGVDANGDGSTRNDPAFVDDAIPGTAELISEWDCLADQVGRFAERNACRTDPVQSLDLRLRVGLVATGRYTAELVVDGLNLIESEIGVPDRALYLVDPTQPLAVDAATGRVTVPLIANPHFGELLVRRNTGRALRLGLRLSY
ncbi:MAG TPA: TonB-dependent receptor [Longimicrobiales bacterium]